jgi:hypothetical protein
VLDRVVFVLKAMHAFASGSVGTVRSLV